jgi:hypothetical protein
VCCRSSLGRQEKDEKEGMLLRKSLGIC